MLFCDLVGSTSIAAKLDPEEWRELAAEYQRTSARAIERFGGRVAQYLGDGVMAHFGWPEAHGDDPERAVRAGLAILEAISKTNELLTDVRLSARVGIDSGVVVIGTGVSDEVEVFGETPNIAARVQAAAAPDTVLITDATHRLVSGLFVVEERGAYDLKGIEQPLQLYHVVQLSGVRGRLEALAATHGLTPFIGRENELRLLGGHWQRVRDGECLALIVGEPGIGKSRLIQRFHENIADTPHTWIELTAAPFFRNTPFYPVSENLRRVVSRRGDESLEEQFAQLESSLVLAGLNPSEAIPLIAPLLNLELSAKYHCSGLSAEQQRRRLLALLVEWVVGLARVQPIVMVIEDLHWVDPSTLELIQMLVEQGPTPQLLLLCTARPEFRVPWIPKKNHMHISLNQLSLSNARTIVQQLAVKKGLSEKAIDTVVERTGGVPLFVEELTRVVVESGDDALIKRVVPVSLNDSLMARLDRLGPAKEVAQLGAVIGYEFSYKLVKALYPLPDQELQSAFAKLTDAELVYASGTGPHATYLFKHALIRDAAYQALLKSRRRELHAGIARTMEEMFPERAASHPEILAYHYTEAGLIAQAVENWRQAGKAAIVRSAHAEASAHLSTALELLPKLPESRERDSTELNLLSDYGVTLFVLKGWYITEVGKVYRRAYELCRLLGDSRRLLTVLFGLSSFHLVRAELEVSQKYALEMSTLASESPDDRSVVIGWSAGITKFFMGEFNRAHADFELAISRYDRERQGAIAFTVGQDLCTTSLVYDAMTLLILGFPDHSEKRLQQAVALARELGHPFTLTHCLTTAAKYCCIRRDFDRVPAFVEETKALAREHRFVFYEETIAAYEIMYFAAKRKEEELKAASRRASRFSELGFALSLTWGQSCMAEGLANLGRIRSSLALLTRAYDMMNQNQERYAEAEIHRIRGVVSLRNVGRDGIALEVQSARLEAEHAFREAKETAQRQGAKLFELRATTDLSRLLAQAGRSGEAHTMLAQICNWFTEGFDTADLKEAKALLAELSR